MKRKLIVRCLIFASLFSLILSTPISAIAMDQGSATVPLKKEKPEKEPNKPEKDTEKTPNKPDREEKGKTKKKDNGRIKRIEIIKKRLDKIEENIHEISEEIGEFYGADTNDEENNLDEGTTIEENEASNSSSSEEEDSANKVDADKETKEVGEDDEDRSNSFIGKLKAHINRLNAVKKQLANLGKKTKEDAAEVAALGQRTEDLIQLAQSEIDRVKALQNGGNFDPPAQEESTDSYTDVEGGSEQESTDQQVNQVTSEENQSNINGTDTSELE